MHRVFPRDYIDGKYRAIAGLNGHKLNIIMFCEENCLFSPWPRALVRGVIDQLCPWHHTVLMNKSLPKFHLISIEISLVGWAPGPCITNVIATCRKNFSQWESSFLWKPRCHWLKFLRRVAKTLVIQGPADLGMTDDMYAAPGLAPGGGGHFTNDFCSQYKFNGNFALL